MDLVDTRATGFCLGDRLGRLSNGPGLRGLAAGVLATPAERAQHHMKERRLTNAAWCCAAVWLGSAVLVHAFAYPLWFERPLSLIAREFDYFAGFASTNGNGFLIGRWLMAALFVLWGLAHVRLAAWMERGAWTSGQAHLLLGAGALACLAGLPLLSPDVFYYLAKGWIESGYGMDAYAVAIRDVPGHEADPMFANVYAGFKNHAGNYGPAFQMLCAWVTGVGGGGLIASLLGFKLVCASAYAACAWMVARSAPQQAGSSRFFLFAGHPLLLYTFLTAAHNDVLMAAAMLGAWIAASGRRWMWAGLLLGLAFSIKWASLMVTPLFFIHALGRPMRGWKAVFAMGSAGMAVACLFHFHHFQSVEILARFLAEGYQVVRGSLFVLLFPLAQGLGGELGIRAALGVCRLLFVVFWLWLAWRLWLVNGGTPAQLGGAIWAVFAAYFLIAAQVVMEWYLIWAMVFAAVQADRRFDHWLGVLAVGVMPWTIFQVKSEMVGTVAANAGFYLALLLPTGGLMVGWLRHRPLERSGVPKEKHAGPG